MNVVLIVAVVLTAVVAVVGVAGGLYAVKELGRLQATFTAQAWRATIEQLDYVARRTTVSHGTRSRREKRMFTVVQLRDDDSGRAFTLEFQTDRPVPGAGSSGSWNVGDRLIKVAGVDALTLERAPE